MKFNYSYLDGLYWCFLDEFRFLVEFQKNILEETPEEISKGISGLIQEGTAEIIVARKNLIESHNR